MGPIIAIVGRPNVGKSTLFNRLSRSRDALVDNMPGVTRDRLYATIVHDNIPFTLIDTGGFEDLGQDPLLGMVRDQVLHAVEESDAIIFLVDGRQGILPGDEEMADILRRTEKKVYLAVNKIDGPEHDHLSTEFYRLGIEPVLTVSAAHGYGIKALLATVTADIPRTPPERDDEDQIRISVLGRPNAGKSSLINRILGHERLVVSNLPGTTRDSVDTPFTWQGKKYLLIDTAGIRRKSKVKKRIEKFSVIKALRSLDRCHIAAILLDAEREISEQDARICGYALDKGKGIVLALNKWDLVKKDQHKRTYLEREMDRRLKFVSFAPMVRISALTGERVMRLLKKIDVVYADYSHRIHTAEVNKALAEMIQKHPPPRIGKGFLKFFYATQSNTKPPTFVVFVNRPDMVHFSYERFLTNQIRDHFALMHTPIRLVFRQR
ncbi:MAG TPA: ribosome biogenesis GTPase Der [Desulfobacteraceae bacterium]|nr:ribosome biogenesis GTPase Der [Desulfobacteraceae bacterium]